MSEPGAGSPQRAVLRDSHKVALLAGLGMLAQVASTLLTLLLVRVLDQEAYGTFRQLFLVADIVAYCTQLAVPSSLLYFLPRLTVHQQKGFVIQSVSVMAVLGLTAALIVLGSGPFVVDQFDNAALAPMLTPLAVYTFALVAAQYIGPMYLAVNQFKMASVVQLAWVVTRVIVTAASVVVFRRVDYVLWSLAALVGGQLLASYWLTLRLWRTVQVEPSPDGVGAQLRYAIPLGVSGLLWFAGKEIDKYYLAATFSAAQYGVFVVGATDVPVFRELSTAISSILVGPIASLQAQDKSDAIAALWRETIRKSTLLFIPAAVMLALVAEPLMATLFTPAYLGATTVFQIYNLTVALRVVNAQFLLQALGRTGVVTCVTVLFVTLNIVFNVLSVRWLGMGIEGPAAATVLAYVVVSAVSTAVALRTIRARATRVFPIRDMSVVLAGCGIAFGAATLIDGLLAPTSYALRLVASAASFSCVFLLVAWRAGVYTADDIRIVTGPLVGSLRGGVTALRRSAGQSSGAA